MKRNRWLIYVFMAFFLIISGCFSNAANLEKSESDQKPASVIALLRVENKTADTKASELLRSKLQTELYFKGYAKLSLSFVDQKLETFYSRDTGGMKEVIAPQVIKELLGADAAMYCTLTESKSDIRLFYAPVTVAASCILRSTQTGEIIWAAQYRSTSRNFDITSKRLEMKSCAAYESTMEEVVNKVMETLPYGPRLRG